MNENIKNRGGHDMKCPKCGSKIKENKDRDVVWDRGRTAFCNKCHIEYRIDDETNDIIYTQPTTAEMLLWLVENIEDIRVYKDGSFINEDTPKTWWTIVCRTEDFSNEKLSEAINKAYKWLKEARDE